MMDMKMRQQAVKEIREKLLGAEDGKPLLKMTILPGKRPLPKMKIKKILSFGAMAKDGEKPTAMTEEDMAVVDDDYCPECDAPMEKGLCPDCEQEERELEGEASTDEAAEDVPPTALKKLISQIVDQKLKG